LEPEQNKHPNWWWWWWWWWWFFHFRSRHAAIL